MPGILVEPPPFVRVEVAYFDEDEARKLRARPTAAVTDDLVANGAVIPTAEFLTYYLFHKKRLGSGEYRDYDEIATKTEKAVALLDGCIVFANGSIAAPPGLREQLTEVNEHVGEALSLSLVSRIHHLTKADWLPIKQQHGRKAARTFDFHLVNLASDASEYIQVESKGSTVGDNRELSDSILAHKRNIDAKKRDMDERSEGRDTLALPRGVRYGIIAAVDRRQDGAARCWLTDPPPDPVGREPRHFRLLARMRFLSEMISFIGPRSKLASALATRLADLERLRDPFELDGLPLRTSTDSPFEFRREFSGMHHAFFATKSRVTDRVLTGSPPGGVVVQLPESRMLFFIGIRGELLDLAVDQGFESIMSYEAGSGTGEKPVLGVFSRARFERLHLPDSIRKFVRRDESQYVTLRLTGRLHYSSCGLVFGGLAAYDDWAEMAKKPPQTRA